MQTQERTHVPGAEGISSRAAQQMRETAAQLGDSVARTTEGLEESLDNIELKFKDVRDSMIRTTKEYSNTVDTYVRKNAWTAIGISAGLALLAGVLIGRQRA